MAEEEKSAEHIGVVEYMKTAIRKNEDIENNEEKGETRERKVLFRDTTALK